MSPVVIAAALMATMAPAPAPKLQPVGYFLNGGVGLLMQPAAAGGGMPPPPTFAITTESGVKITTETPTPIRTETP